MLGGDSDGGTDMTAVVAGRRRLRHRRQRLRA